MSNEVTLLPRFCERTGNPCGTDTVHNDEPGCSCRQCMLWCREELKRRWVAMDDQRAENEKLRIALSDCANHAAGYRCTSSMCSTEFLLRVPEEVRLQIGARERDRDENRAGMQRLEAERDQAVARIAAIQALDTPWPLFEVLRRLCDAADHLLRDHDCDVHGYEGIGLARDAGRAIVQRVQGSRSA